MRTTLLAVLLFIATCAQAAPAPGQVAEKKKDHSSPFAGFTKSLTQEKRKPFMELMKRLRSAKAASVGNKEEKKKALTSLDADIHKLLGNEYKRYRATAVSRASNPRHPLTSLSTVPVSRVMVPHALLPPIQCVNLQKAAKEINAAKKASLSPPSAYTPPPPPAKAKKASKGLSAKKTKVASAA